jgi:outer membrane protein
MRYACAIGAGLVALAGAGVTGAGEPKLGFVDLNRALVMCDEGKQARERFVAEMDRLQSKLRKEKEELDTQREEFDKKAMLLRDKERMALEQKIEDQQLAFRRKSEDYQRDLKRLDAEYTGSILRGLEQAIAQIGEDGGYTMIFEVQNSGIVYGDPGADLTEELISRYNAASGKAKKKD